MVTFLKVVTLQKMRTHLRAKKNVEVLCIKASLTFGSFYHITKQTPGPHITITLNDLKI